MQLANKRSRCKGVGLIEVLISLVVIGVSVLGMAALHTRALQHNQSAYIHSRATFLAMDMLDRIRSNAVLARTSDNYQVSSSGHIFNDCLASRYPDDCEAASCSPEQIAAYDIQQWKFHLNCELPEATGSISFSDSGSERVFVIRLGFPTDIQGYPVDDVVLRGAL